MKILEFNARERKYVTAVVRTQKENDEFIIDGATWQLYTGPDQDDIYVPKGQSVQEAKKEKDCTIDQEKSKISALVEITEKGVYILEFTVIIGLERIIERATIRVI